MEIPWNKNFNKGNCQLGLRSSWLCLIGCKAFINPPDALVLNVVLSQNETNPIIIIKVISNSFNLKTK
jgi:hypothetical protein